MDTKLGNYIYKNFFTIILVIYLLFGFGIGLINTGTKTDRYYTEHFNSGNMALIHYEVDETIFENHEDTAAATFVSRIVTLVMLTLFTFIFFVVFVGYLIGGLFGIVLRDIITAYVFALLFEFIFFYLLSFLFTLLIYFIFELCGFMKPYKNTMEEK